MTSISNKSELMDLSARLAEAVDLACARDAELDSLRVAYLSLLAKYRALLSGSLPAVERARIDEAAALAIAVATGARLRMAA